jgi:hypothetical protein
MFRQSVPKEVADRIKMRAEMTERLEAADRELKSALASADFAQKNVKGLREVFQALPELDPANEKNLTELEWVCAPEPVSLERVLSALENTDLLSRLQLKS